MRIAAIIAEYNPFHNGHRYQIEQLRQSGVSHVVAIMSPNFVQRGEPAKFEKRVRAAAALQNGVDLVIELPTPYAVSCAENFARGAAEIIQGMGCVDELCFGSECGNMDSLLETMEKLEQPHFDTRLKEHLSAGVSYAKARDLAAGELFGEEMQRLLQNPNDVLGMEYIRALRRVGCAVDLHPIQRIGVAHDATETQEIYASASKIRELFSTQYDSITQNFLPGNAFSLYQQDFMKNNGFSDLKRAERVILYHLRTMTDANYANLPDISEGIENKLKKAAGEAHTLEELYELTKSKRFTMARVKRLICNAFNGVTQTVASAPVPYLHILGFTKAGEDILNRMKTTAKLPVSVSLSRLQTENTACSTLAKLESQCTDNFALTLPTVMPTGAEYTNPVVKV